MKEFILNLQFIFRPNFWFMNNEYNKVLDELFNVLLDKYDFKDVNYHTARLGEYTIWIANYPYGSMVIDDILLYRYRPSRLTILRAKNKLKGLEKDVLEDYKKAIKKEKNC